MKPISHRKTRLNPAKLALAASFVLLPASLQAATHAELESEIAALKQQLQQLVSTVNKNRLEVVNLQHMPKRKGKKNSKTFGSDPRNFRLGNTNFSIGGMLKMDFNFSDYSDGSNAAKPVGEDLFVPATIPVGGQSGDMKFHSSAKNSRFHIISMTKLKQGHLKTFLEYDFLASDQGNERVSNSYSPRVRHAFLEWNIDGKNSLLAGQNWSTFTNMKVKAETLVLLGPAGLNMIRQEQLRYTRKLKGGNFQLALENPSSTLYGGTENPYDDNSLPDIIVRYNGFSADFDYTLVAMTRELKYEQAGNSEKEQGYALNFSGKYKIGRDDLRFNFNYGNALGRYMGLNSFRAGAIDSNGNIDLIDQWGITLAYRHFWNQKWRSNLALSATSADNPNFVGAKTPSDYQSLNANLLYQAAPKFTIGGEYLYASKELENRGNVLADDQGRMSRLQLSMKYAF